jgi:DNA-binding response OmpR family regulator
VNNRILVVEDDRYITSDLKLALEIFGYDPTIINKADEVLEIADFDSFKCIILDIMMKTYGKLEKPQNLEAGEAIYYHIRKSSNTPIIIASAMDKEDIDINFDDEKVEYLKKPLSGLDEIMGLIKRV